jgi:hypothetical protein
VKLKEESKTEDEEEEDVFCRMGTMRIPVASKDGSKVEEIEIPLALCMVGDKIEVRVPDKKIVAKLFPKEETDKKGKKVK